MAVANPRKNHRFALEIAGIDQLLIQEVDLPDVEVTEVTHGGAVNESDIKTPGKKKIGDLVMRKLKASTSADNWVWPWLELTIRTIREAHAQYAFLKEVDETGFKTIARYELGEIWPKKITGLQYKREGDPENLIEEITFSISKFTKLIEPGV